MKRDYVNTSNFLKRAADNLDCASKAIRKEDPKEDKEDSEEDSSETDSPMEDPSKSPPPTPKRNSPRGTKRSQCFKDKSRRTPCETQEFLGMPPPGPLGPASAPIAPVVASAPPPPAMLPFAPVAGFPVPIAVTPISTHAVIFPLTTITRGTALHQRISNRVTIRNVSIRGQLINLILPSTPDGTTIYPELRKLRILVVVDHQGRNDPFAPPPFVEEVLSSVLPDFPLAIPPEHSTLMAHQRYDNRYRFTILMDRTLSLGAWTGVYPTAVNITPPYSADFDFSVKSCFECTYANRSIPRKNEHLLYLIGTDGATPGSVQRLEAQISTLVQFQE